MVLPSLLDLHASLLSGAELPGRPTRVQLPRENGAGIACGVFGALVEAISNHGLDNFTIQIAASAATFVLLA